MRKNMMLLVKETNARFTSIIFFSFEFRSVVNVFIFFFYKYTTF